VKKETPSDAIGFFYDQHRLLMELDAAGDTDTFYTSTLEEYGDLLSEYDGATIHSVIARNGNVLPKFRLRLANPGCRGCRRRVRWKHHSLALPHWRAGKPETPFACAAPPGELVR
jgi:hypothetical protein